jgi:hypothetical protein
MVRDSFSCHPRYHPPKKRNTVSYQNPTLQTHSSPEHLSSFSTSCLSLGDQSRVLRRVSWTRSETLTFDFVSSMFNSSKWLRESKISWAYTNPSSGNWILYEDCANFTQNLVSTIAGYPIVITYDEVLNLGVSINFTDKSFFWSPN